jgi:hypothetical protein
MQLCHCHCAHAASSTNRLQELFDEKEKERLMQAQRLEEVDEEINSAKTAQVKALRKCEAIHSHSANTRSVSECECECE